MQKSRTIGAAASALGVLLVPVCAAQTATQPTFTLKVDAKIVFLDVTVLDRHDHPVTQGLTKDDFTVTEEKKVQPITSFEAPQEHGASLASSQTNSDENFRTEIVLDRLNATLPEFSNTFVDLRRFLLAQPSQLKQPVELMLLDNTSFEMVQAYTQDRDELISALDGIRGAIPWKSGSEWYSERLMQSITALREIAFRNEGLAGRKNVLWLGNGIGANLNGLSARYDRLRWFCHDTTNALVNGRISLFVIAPSLSAEGLQFVDLEKVGFGGINQNDPFSADIGTAPFAFQTGGSVMREGNSTNVLMTRALDYGSSYYTLTYRPPSAAPDGHFHRVFVQMRNPNLRAVTKIGYYATDSHAPLDARQQEMLHVTSEARSAIPLDTLALSVAKIVRHTDTGTVEVVVHLKADKVQWQSDDEGKSHADLMLVAASLDRRREVLAFRFQDLPLQAATQDKERLAALTNSVHMTLRAPRKTHSIRIVMESGEHGRAGSVEISRASIDAAIDSPTPAPTLSVRPPLPQSTP